MCIYILLFVSVSITFSLLFFCLFHLNSKKIKIKISNNINHKILNPYSIKGSIVETKKNEINE